MAIDSVGAAQNANQGQATQTTTVGQQDLFSILLTQLSYQDPLKPLDNQEFVSKLAQFSSLEQSRQLNDKIDSLLSVQSGNQAMGLLGKSVEVNTDNGTTVGDVTAVAFNQGSPVLTIRGTNGQFLNDIRLSQIAIVR